MVPKKPVKGAKSLGTTKKGIGPCYSSKATCNGVRIGDLLDDFNLFSDKFRAIVTTHSKLFPHIEEELLKNVEELKRYEVYAERIRSHVKDTFIFT